MRRVVCYGATRNLYHEMAAAAKSLLRYTKVDRVIFLTEDDEFPEELPSVIEIHNISGQNYFDEFGINYNTPWTYMTLMRLALPLLFPEEGRILWLDVDTIVTADIGRLFETDMGGCFLAAVEEPKRSKPPFVYFNAGVLLLDCAKLREGKAQEIVDFANTELLPCADQDAVNLMCAGKIKKLPSIYNGTRFCDTPLNAIITHYAAIKDWKSGAAYRETEKAKWRVSK